MECALCGYSLGANARFCGRCGAQVAETGAASVPAAADAHAVAGVPAATGAPAQAVPAPAGVPVSPQRDPAAAAAPCRSPAAAAQPLTYEDLIRYHETIRAQQAFEQSLKDAQDYLDYAVRRHHSLHGTLGTCTAIGIVLLVMYACMALPSFYSIDLAVGAFTTIVPSPFVIALPFGFVPIKNWFAKHGFAIIATWAFLLIFGIILIYIALFAGIPYYFYLRGEVKRAEQAVAEAQAHLQQLSGMAP